MFSLLLAWTNFCNISRFVGVEKHQHVLFRLYFHWNSKVQQQILKFLREIIIEFTGKIFQDSDVIISVFSLDVCTQICYNGRGVANSLVPISPPNKPCDLFWLCPGDRFTALHQYTNTTVQVEWKIIYHPNNGNAYNQVTQITQLNFNWGMLGVSSDL